MKKLRTSLLAVCSLVLLSACSDDDPPIYNGGGNGNGSTENGGNNESQNGGNTTETFDNWNDPASLNYKKEGYNPVVGKWSDSTSDWSSGWGYTFTDNFKMVRTLYTSGAWIENYRMDGDYIINDKQMKFDRNIPYTGGDLDILSYNIVADTLYLTTPTSTLKYYRRK